MPAAIATAAPHLLDMENPLLAERGRLRLMEPVGAPIRALQAQLLDGTYRKPFILEDGQLRYLHLGLTYIQSVMRLDDPDALDLRYTQKMMGFLLFHPQPAHVLLLGLGGGSLAKYCYRQLPETQITAVEIDPDVIALREHFMIPADNERFRVVCDDGVRHLATQSEAFDAILIDAFDSFGLAESVSSNSFDFLQTACQRLSAEGVVVMNLAGDTSRCETVIADAMAVFKRQVRVIPVTDDGNQILFAFRNPRFEPAWQELRGQAKKLRAKHRLDFPSMLHLLERASGRA